MREMPWYFPVLVWSLIALPIGVIICEIVRRKGRDDG